jgi:hypothetical protein
VPIIKPAQEHKHNRKIIQIHRTEKGTQQDKNIKDKNNYKNNNNNTNQALGEELYIL